MDSITSSTALCTNNASITSCTLQQSNGQSLIFSIQSSHSQCGELEQRHHHRGIPFPPLTCTTLPRLSADGGRWRNLRKAAACPRQKLSPSREGRLEGRGGKEGEDGEEEGSEGRWTWIRESGEQTAVSACLQHYQRPDCVGDIPYLPEARNSKHKYQRPSIRICALQATP